MLMDFLNDNRYLIIYDKRVILDVPIAYFTPTVSFTILIYLLNL